MAKIGLPKYGYAPWHHRHFLTPEEKLLAVRIYSALFKALSNQAEVCFNDFQSHDCDTGVVTVVYWSRDTEPKQLGEVNVFVSGDRVTFVVTDHKNTNNIYPMCMLEPDDQTGLHYVVNQFNTELESYGGHNLLELAYA